MKVTSWMGIGWQALSSKWSNCFEDLKRPEMKETRQGACTAGDEEGERRGRRWVGRIRPVGTDDGPEVVSLDGLGDGQPEKELEARRYTFWLREMI